MGTYGYFAKLANFTASSRKKSLIPFGLFSPGDNLEFLATTDPAQYITVTGTIDGTNPTFTIPSTTGMVITLFKNGVLQHQGIQYTLAGSTITFLDPYIPQTGDVVLAFVN